MSGWNSQYRDPRLIPDNIVRMMPPEERRRLGKHCMTQEERQAKLDAKAEKQLQEHIANLLRHRGITFDVSRMDKPKTNVVGWPDFVFSFRGRFVGIEVKMPGETPTKEQVEVMAGLIRNGAFVRVVCSVEQFMDALRELDAELG